MERSKRSHRPGPVDADKVACQVLVVQAASWCERSLVSRGVSVTTSFAHLPAATLASGRGAGGMVWNPSCREQPGVGSCLAGECVMWQNPYSHDVTPASVSTGL